MKRSHVLGFATSTGQIPFTFDRATGPGIKRVVPITGSELPAVGDQRAAVEEDGEKVIYSIGAVIDPSKSSFKSLPSTA